MSYPDLIASRKREPLTIVEPRSDAAALPESIVATATAILREEMQSLGASPMNWLSGTWGANRSANQVPLEALREQARALIDTFVSAMSQGPNQLPEFVEQLTGSARPDDGMTRDTVLVIQAARPATAGDVGHVSLRLENDDSETDTCTICVTDLIGPSGRRIPAAHVRACPQHPSIPGGGATDVQIEIRVPSGTPPGCYTGLLQTDDGESLRALVRLVVSA